MQIPRSELEAVLKHHGHESFYLMDGYWGDVPLAEMPAYLLASCASEVLGMRFVEDAGLIWMLI